MGIRRSPTCFFLSCKNILVHCEKTEKRRKMDGQCFALLIDADNVSAKYIKSHTREFMEIGPAPSIPAGRMNC